MFGRCQLPQIIVLVKPVGTVRLLDAVALIEIVVTVNKLKLRGLVGFSVGGSDTIAGEFGEPGICY